MDSQDLKLVPEVKVLIGLSTAEHIRKADFLPHFLNIHKPDGTLLITVHGQSPAKSRNMIIDQAIENQCTHILFLDDDMIPSGDVLDKLLVHDKDIVTGLYLLRTFPHYPAFFDEAYDNGRCKYFFLNGDASGLTKGVNCGLGCVLIKTEVFKHLEKPYVRLGEIEQDGWCDDVGFFNRCRNAGFEIYCDLDVSVGHMTTITMFPEKHGGVWYTNYKHPTGHVLIAQNIPTLDDLNKEIALQSQSKELAPV